MLLPIKITQKPGIVEWDFKALREQLNEQLKSFRNVVVDEEQIAEYKLVLANLNKVAKVIDDERKRIKGEYSLPLVSFEKEVKELTNEILTVRAEIDEQIKEYERVRREQKILEIREIYETLTKPGFVEFETIYDEKWSLASVSKKTVKTLMEERIAEIQKDLTVLSNLENITDREFAIKLYEKKLNLLEVLDIVKLSKREPQPTLKPFDYQKDINGSDETFYTVTITITGTQDDLIGLSDYMNGHGIEWEKV